jgi:hypothetical protein
VPRQAINSSAILTGYVFGTELKRHPTCARKQGHVSKKNWEPGLNRNGRTKYLLHSKGARKNWLMTKILAHEIIFHDQANTPAIRIGSNLL